MNIFAGKKTRISWLLALLLLCLPAASYAQQENPPGQTQPSPTQPETPSQPEDQTQTQTPAGEADQPSQEPGEGGTESVNNGIQPSTPPGEVPNSEENVVPVPLPLNLDASSLRFSSETEHRNYLRGGVNLGASYDDNILAQPTHPVGSATYSVMPNLMLDQARSRLFWALQYAGGFVVNQRFSAYNQGSHDVGIDLRYRVSPHVNFHLRDHYTLTSNFSDQLQAGSGLTSSPGTGPVQQPNQSIVTPLAKTARELGTAEMTWQFSAGDMVGGSATFYDSRFKDVPQNVTSLVNTQSEEGDGFYSHRITTRNWAGVAYKFQRLTFNPTTETDETQSFLLFDTIYLKPRMALSLFAGPEYSTLNTEMVSTLVTLPLVQVTSDPITTHHWYGAGGVSFNWQGARTSAQLSAVRKVSDGGGLLSAVEYSGGAASLRRQFTPSTAIEVGAIYSQNHALDPSAANGDLNSASGSLALEQRLGRSFSANLGYARDYLQSQGGVTLPGQVNHNRGWVTLSYHFDRPLGR
ncbi:MAG TPA: hypothetical protein VLV49_16685 [Terriglobales bacterium]|nr:hypothetical protein [Terriglobales bacterium]